MEEYKKLYTFTSKSGCGWVVDVRTEKRMQIDYDKFLMMGI